MTLTPVSMIKTFTLNAIEHKEVSKGKGLITYHVVDENKVPRKVAGVTTLDRKKNIKHIRAVYERETPLVNALSGLPTGKKVRVDFREFNKTFTRAGSSPANRGSAYTENALIDTFKSGSYLLPTILKFSIIALVIYFLLMGYLSFSEFISAGMR